MARIIPRERLAAYQRWQIGDFEAKATSLPAAPVEPEHAEEADSMGEPVAGPLQLPTAEEIEAIHERARQEGFEAGLQEGRTNAEAQMREAVLEKTQQINQLTANFQAALGELDQVVAEQTLDLALEVAAQVLRAALPVHRELLLPSIREALQALPIHHGNIALHLHPEDLSALHDGLSEITATGGMHLVPDNSIHPGGCLIKAGQSEIDATLETRWKRVLEAIGVNPESWLIR